MADLKAPPCSPVTSKNADTNQIALPSRQNDIFPHLVKPIVTGQHQEAPEAKRLAESSSPGPGFLLTTPSFAIAIAPINVRFDLYDSTALTTSLMMNHKRLLILSCSQRKSHKEGLLPAIERYDGPLFRILRRYRKTQDTRNREAEPSLSTYILSAEFGLISAEYPIPYYDCCMTRHRAQILHPVVVDKLKNLLTGGCRFQELFICLGQAYWPALEGWEAFVRRDMAVHVAWGAIGMRQSQLYEWLYGTPPSASAPSKSGQPSLRGMAVELSPQQIFEIARQGLRGSSRMTTFCHMWYIPVDGQRVAPKWLVSRLTGLPVSTFRTDDARRLLAQLGIEVRRA